MLVRALIVLLLVLNAGVAAWWIAHDPPPPPAPVEPPPGVARLQLVGEAGATAVPTRPDVAPPPRVPAPEPEALAPQCYRFGPYASRPVAEAAAAALQAQVRRASVREEPDAASARAWRVFLPPLPSPEEAQATAQRIGAAGFGDFLVVRDGAEANSIALGRYRSETAASRRREALAAAGFAARMEPVGANAVAWLDVVADAGFDPRRARAAIDAAQYRPLECPPQR